MAEKDVVSRTFRALVESADRKFARVRDLPQHGRSQSGEYFKKVFKAYMRLWKYQQENRSKLIDSGLNRWEIGEIASRIGQLYFSQYMRTSEAKFLVETYVFYDAILNRRYFEGAQGKDLGVLFKEMRFYARFLVVSLILNRSDMVEFLAGKLRAIVDDDKTKFRDTHFKEWKVVIKEIDRFMKVGTAFKNFRPLRYCPLLDSHPASQSCIARFHAKKVLRLRDALLTSYHRNEVKYAEFTLDTYRMLQCLEWEPSGSFNQKYPVEHKENGHTTDRSGPSGLIDINLTADLTDPTLPPNPKKAILYRPSVSRLLAVLATISDELPLESVMLVYLSASGKSGHVSSSRGESSEDSGKSSKSNVFSRTLAEPNSVKSESHSNGKGGCNDYYNDYLWFGPRGNSGSNNLYPGDLIPFTRRPLFFIIDSDNSHAFKVLHSAERGETAALLLSPLRPVFINQPAADNLQKGSQFTYFLTAPLQAFCQMVDLTSSDTDEEAYDEAENILSTAFSDWELILCTTKTLNLVWAQVLSDPFLRRIILRFIFCRSLLSLFIETEDNDQFLPICLPPLPNSLSPRSEVVRTCIRQLANHLGVSDFFCFGNT